MVCFMPFFENIPPSFPDVQDLFLLSYCHLLISSWQLIPTPLCLLVSFTGSYFFKKKYNMTDKAILYPSYSFSLLFILLFWSCIIISILLYICMFAHHVHYVLKFHIHAILKHPLSLYWTLYIWDLSILMSLDLVHLF